MIDVLLAPAGGAGRFDLYYGILDLSNLMSLVLILRSGAFKLGAFN